MKLFRYSMQSVLEYRRDIEEDEKQKFAKAQNEYIRQRETLNGLKQKLDHAFLTQVGSSQHQVQELKNLAEYIQYLKEKIDIQKQLVMEAQEIMEARRQELISAQRDRKIIEKHKEKSLEQYYSELNLAEQKTIDELALYSYIRR